MEKKTEQKVTTDLQKRFLFRSIRQEEAKEAALAERVCFPPHEACSEEMIRACAAAAPDLFLVAKDRQTGKIAGFLYGLATKERSFRDAFFTDAGLHDPNGETVMLLGLGVLPEYRRQGLAEELMRRYFGREREKGRRMLRLTCLPAKVKMYQRMGFCDGGFADSAWGGEQWHEMSRAIEKGAVCI